MYSSALSELLTLEASSVQVFAKARTVAFKKHHRRYDLVLFGATGYTGLMTAEHIALHLPTDLRWAIAGRSVERLQNVVRECHGLNADRRMPEIEVWDLNDADLAALAKKTFITTVGPFAKYGEDAFKACAEAGTHYLDCTGEAIWTLEMIQKYEATAKSTGACMITQCGVESATSDLMTYSIASLIRSELSAATSDVVVDFHEVQFIFKPGEEPSREEGANNYFEVWGVATPDVESSVRKQALCRAWYSGSMYYLTGILLAQAACTLLQGGAPLEGAGGGVYTPACLGQKYIRVHEHGFKFETKIVDA
ncbi:hypothetical protein DL766_004559 [Monosporascus sp. MC13-8B]|uniref:Saccharopine dehydrogenase NADP binding domain-containing protein n=1 Tax=Monosporascus cannonballus TaxID=155416 RepID=A0ABY0GXE9_9PEZI|nr:hypothetical protein DL762_008375 [Monosporascus cannonballus]RYP31039.1 hypothetical protein DL766_004559 [Monosporascus sp. MC13-8B]